MNTLEMIIKENAGLIWNIAKRFYGVDKNDLYQAGVLGLINAYKNYCKDGDTKFSTYAYKYIFGEMYALSANKDIKVSKDLTRLVKMIEMGRVRLSQELMRNPSNMELAAFLEMDQDKMEVALQCMSKMVSMDEDNEESRNLHETIASNEEVSTDDRILLNDSINNLNELEQDIINARYFEDLTQSETAKKLGVTQVMVSRYEQRSLKKMKEFMYM